MRLYRSIKYQFIILLLIVIFIRTNYWKIHHTLSEDSFSPWMDIREQMLIIKHLTQFKQINKRLSVMLEYGAGGSTFTLSKYVDRYISIEHDLNYCRICERIAISQPNRTITISYMKMNGSNLIEFDRFKQISHDPTIEIYCIPPDEHLTMFQRIFQRPKRSTYSMYRNYVDFVSIYLPDELFDFVLIDGRARPQTAYQILKQLNGQNAKVFVHDWNHRRDYHVITDEFYDIIDQQIRSTQPGGGGLVVLHKKFEVTGQENIDQIQWKHHRQPTWWI